MTTPQSTQTADPIIGRCRFKGCSFVTSATTADDRTLYECPTHARLVSPRFASLTWRRVKGTHKAGVACDVRCTSARGNDCECSCVGANHGTDHRGNGLLR